MLSKLDSSPFFILKKRKPNILKMDESFDPLKCNEDLPSSPGCHMEYGKTSQKECAVCS